MTWVTVMRVSWWLEEELADALETGECSGATIKIFAGSAEPGSDAE
jgi:hypothetical protein